MQARVSVVPQWSPRLQKPPRGGRAPQVQRSAKERLAELVEPALKGLHKALKSGEIPSIVKAAQIVLDRTGFHPTQAMEIYGERWWSR
jgi:hypothetical protein